MNNLKVSEDQINQIKFIFKKYNKQVSCIGISDWTNWLETRDLDQCIHEINQTYQNNNLGGTEYRKVCYEILGVFYGDIMNSPLWQALKEDE